MRDYYDIAVIGYSGDDEVYSLLPGGRELISVAELAAGEPPIKTEVIEYRLPDGSISLREIPYPAWVEPEAAGQTPMCEALRRVRDIAAAWCADPAPVSYTHLPWLSCLWLRRRCSRRSRSPPRWSPRRTTCARALRRDSRS